MQNVSQCQCSGMGQTQNAAYDRLQQSSSLQMAAVSSERSADITIVTDENDKVTLSLDAHLKGVALTYDEKTQTDTSRSQTRAGVVGYEVERQMELSVEGHLDDQERKEIRQVLRSIFKMVKSFLAGKFTQGAGEARRFDDLETIKSVKADFEARDAAAYVSQDAAKEVAQVQAPAPQAIAPPSGAQPIRPAAVKPQAPPAKAAEPVKAPAAALAEKMVEAVKDSGVDPIKIQKPVDDMFGRLMRRFMKEGPFNFRQMRRLRSVMQEFSHRMEKLAAPGKSETTEPSVLQPVSDEDAEKVAPMGVFTVKRSAVQTQVRIFEQSVSFSFEYSAARPDAVAEEEVTLEA